MLREELICEKVFKNLIWLRRYDILKIAKNLDLARAKSVALVNKFITEIKQHLQGVSKVRSDFLFAQISLIIENTFCKT